MLKKTIIPRMTALVSMVAFTGCSPYHTWTTYSYNKLGYETKTIELANREYQVKFIQTQMRYLLRITEHVFCQRIKEERSEEVLVHRVKAPSWLYLTLLGSAFVAISVPFYIIAGKAKGTKRTANLLVGSLLFLTPGLVMGTVGIYLKLMEGTTRRKLGIVTRPVLKEKTPCGQRPAADRAVSLMTRVGRISIGKTDKQGRIVVPKIIRPMIRYENEKIKKIYLEVFVEDRSIGEYTVPWKIDPLTGYLIAPWSPSGGSTVLPKRPSPERKPPR